MCRTRKYCKAPTAPMMTATSQVENFGALSFMGPPFFNRRRLESESQGGREPDERGEQ